MRGTWPSVAVERVAASASQSTTFAISCTRLLTPRASAVAERSCESLARRQGCEEMWTLAGKGAAMLGQLSLSGAD